LAEQPVLLLVGFIAYMRAEGRCAAEGGPIGVVVGKHDAIKRVSLNACEVLRRIAPPDNAILKRVLKTYLVDDWDQPLFQLIHERDTECVYFLSVIHVGEMGSPKRIGLDDPPQTGCTCVVMQFGVNFDDALRRILCRVDLRRCRAPNFRCAHHVRPSVLTRSTFVNTANYRSRRARCLIDSTGAWWSDIALQVETRAVLRHLETGSEEVVDGAVFHRGRFEGWDVAVAEIGAGNAAAASVTQRAVQHFRPQVALFVGVAGGVKDVALGDVVVATEVYGYESGKEDASRFKARPEVLKSAHVIEQRGRAVGLRDNWRKRLPDSCRSGWMMATAELGQKPDTPPLRRSLTPTDTDHASLLGDFADRSSGL